MICPHCGKEIANDSKFCEFCGKKIKTKGNNKKKIILWVAIASVISFIALIIGLRFYYESDAYEKKYVRSIYSIEIPDRCNSSFFDRHDRSFIYYEEGEIRVWISGGNHFYAACNSLPEWFDYAEDNYFDLGVSKNSFKEIVINGIPAMYGKEIRGDMSYQTAILYSENTGCYIIMCQYQTSQKDYYDKEMRNTIFSFKEK